jgi:hypothetical protein
MTETLLTPSQAEAMDNHAEQQACAQYESICRLLDAVEVDYDRLEELKESMGGEDWTADDADELEMLQADAGECTDEDDARERLSEDPLEVTVRSGWVSQGDKMTADDFQILLCTGGPAVRIMGELDANGAPCRAWMEYQDWGTPWTQYFGAEQSRLIAYAENFFY